MVKAKSEPKGRADEARLVTLVVCAVCGSSDMQVMEWIDANTFAVIGGAECSSDVDTFCEACDEAGRDPNPGTSTREVPLAEALEFLAGRPGFDADTVREGAHP